MVAGSCRFGRLRGSRLFADHFADSFCRADPFTLVVLDALDDVSVCVFAEVNRVSAVSLVDPSHLNLCAGGCFSAVHDSPPRFSLSWLFALPTLSIIKHTAQYVNALLQGFFKKNSQRAKAGAWCALTIRTQIPAKPRAAGVSGQQQ